MRKQTVALALVVALAVVLIQSQAVAAAQPSPTTGALITVHRSTVVYGNYAVVNDNITVVKGNVSSLVAYFPDGVQLLNATGADLSYAYQLSSAPARVVLGLRTPVGAGGSTLIKYVYTGFSSGGAGDIAVDSGYSVASVNDTGVVSDGVSQLNFTLQMPYAGKIVNVTLGSAYLFKGVTGSSNYTEATLSQDPFADQVYLTQLSRVVTYSGDGYTVSDSVVATWSSSGTGGSIYLTIPSYAVKSSVRVSDDFGNVSSTLYPGRFGNRSLLVVSARYQLSQGQSYGFHVTYRVPGSQVDLSTLGFFDTFVRVADISVFNAKPSAPGWIPFDQGHGYAVYDRNIYQTAEPAVTLTPQPPSAAFSDAATGVAVAGFIAVVFSGVYYSVSVRKKQVRIKPGLTLIPMLIEALDSLEAAVENTRKYVSGTVRVNVANSSVAALDEQERRMVKALGDAVSAKQIEKSSADTLVSVFRQAKTALADLVDLQSQFNQKKIRQNVYQEIRSRYQKAYSSAVSRFKSEVDDLRR